MTSSLQAWGSTKRERFFRLAAVPLYLFGLHVASFPFGTSSYIIQSRSEDRALTLSSFMLSSRLRYWKASRKSYNMSHHRPLAAHPPSEASSPAPDDESADFFSLTHLQRRVANYVAKQDNPKLCIVVAGGGGHFMATLAATPSASKVLIDGTIAYSRESFSDYLTKNGHSSNNFAEAMSMSSRMNEDASFKFCSMPAAKMLADAACKRSLQLMTGDAAVETSPEWGVLLRSAAGVACTSVLQTVGRKSHERHGSQTFCSVVTSTGSFVHLYAQLAQSIGRTRLDEDIFVSHCILSCLELLKSTELHDKICLPGFSFDSEVSLRNDELQTDQPLQEAKGTSVHGDSLQVYLSMKQALPPTPLQIDVRLRAAAERILSGCDEVVLVLPHQGSLDVLHTTRLPPNSLIVPGSFNPPHAGHVTLARTAAEAVSNCSAIWFELSITNVDKPPLQLDTIVERLKHLLALYNEMPEKFCWGILLTNAPLFKQKVRLLAPLQIGVDSKLHFSIGTDTLVRLIDPKYYNDSQEEMLSVLTGLPCHFVVGGRLDQRKPKSKSVFLDGDDVIAQLPESL
jgi:Cytidylyltransferase-like